MNTKMQNKPDTKYTTLTDQQLRRSLYISVLMTMLFPPFIGSTLMGFVGFYPMPQVYLIFFSYTGPYVLACLIAVLSLVPAAYRYVTKLTQLENTVAVTMAHRTFAKLPWILLVTVTVYSMGGALSADLSMEAMGLRNYTVREHLYNQFGLIPVVLISFFPIFFFFIDRISRYLAPRGVVVTAIPLWLKLTMLGLVTPLLIDSLLIGYYFNRTGFFQAETLALWFSLMALAVGGTWLALRNMEQGMYPLEKFISTTSGTLAERARDTLTPISLDEFGVLTSRYASLLTSQQKLSTDLEQSQLLAESVINNAGALVLTLDKEGRILNFNAACEKISGYDISEVNGKFPWDILLPPEDAENIRKNAFEILANNPKAMGGRYTNYWVGKTGKRFLIDWSNTVLLDEQGRMEYIISVGTDVTQRMQTEQVMKLNELRLKEAQRIAKVGSWELDLSNNTLSWSDEIFNIFQIDKERFTASYDAFLNAIHPDDRDMVNKAYTDSLSNRQPYEIVHRLQMQDGAIKYVRETCESSFSDDGKPLRSIGTVQDITELYKVELELLKHRTHLEVLVLERTLEMKTARDEAERANAAKSDFLSRMSHELRTPLNAILGFGQLLKIDPDYPLAASQIENVDEILHGGNHLLALINEVLDLARIESGKLSLRLEMLAMNPALEACIKQIQPMAAQHNIEVTLEPCTPVIVVADAIRLKEVLFNLLSNAVKYNRKGGTIQISCAIIGDRLRVNVQDTGKGIPAESLPRLFRPFERLESAYEGIDGTGIGLALTKKLVEGMNGTVGVESRVGNGSTFWFELPISTQAPASPAVEPAPASAHTSSPLRHKVLYVEDNAPNLRLVEKMLAPRRDIAFLRAENGERGLDVANRERPDLILLDISMAGMDGYQVLKKLRENPLTRNITVIAVTANAMPQDIERGLAAGFAEYLTKPVELEKLNSVLQKFL